MPNLNGATIFINNNSEGGLASAIDKSVDGDIIHLAYGIYTNENCLNLKINKKIAIEGENSIIDANKKTNVFSIDENGGLNLSKITIANARANYGAGINNDGGILNIIFCKFINNFASSEGGAIFNSQSNSFKIISCDFINNRADIGGGGAIENEASNALIKGSNFINNSANGAGAINNYYSVENFIVTKSNFINNKAKGSCSCGGAIVNEASSNFIINKSNFTNNTAGFAGGAVYNFYGDKLNIINSRFIHNMAHDSGSAIYSDLSYHGCIINSVFLENVLLPFKDRSSEIGVIYICGNDYKFEKLTLRGNDPNNIYYNQI
jgi:hypothetical protein